MFLLFFGPDNLNDGGKNLLGLYKPKHI